LLHEKSTRSLWPISNFEENKNSMLAQWLMQDGHSIQYQGPMPNLLSHKRLDYHPSAGSINMFLFAADKEELIDPKYHQ